MSYDYYYYDTSADVTEMLMALFSGFLVVGLVALVISLVCYIFEAIGLYTIAKRRGIKSPWLAWIPIGSSWLCGCIADQYQYVARGKVKNRRMIILILSLANMILSLMINGQVMGALVNIVSNMGAMEYMSEAEAMALMAPLFGSTAISMFGSIVSIVLTVFLYIALYDLFNSCDPGNSTMFLVLSIIFGITLPFFIFADRNKDLGMPPRKQEPQPYTPQEPWMNQ